MKSEEETLAAAGQVLDIEAETITNLKNLLKPDFYHAIKTIYESKGRVVVTGVGKSAIIANKIVATLNSTGTPAIFMHAADAVHGDLGMLQKEDVVICISNSGNTPEIKLLVPWLKRGGNRLIAMVGNTDSFLAISADYILHAGISQEACPHNLAPTSSTTAQLALGDALAVCLLQWRDFTPEDFARFHPGGTLGKRLYLRVSDIYPQNQKPQVLPNAALDDIIMEITSKRLGAAAVIGNNGEIEGIITDGDLRRWLSKGGDLRSATAADIMGKNPKTIGPDSLASEALVMMTEKKITQLVVAVNGRYLGMVHIHDLNREGIIA